MRKEPETIAELRAEIGRLQAKLASKVLGDQTKGVSFQPRPSSLPDHPAAYCFDPNCRAHSTETKSQPL